MGPLLVIKLYFILGKEDVIYVRLGKSNVTRFFGMWLQYDFLMTK